MKKILLLIIFFSLFMPLKTKNLSKPLEVNKFGTNKFGTNKFVSAILLTAAGIIVLDLTLEELKIWIKENPKKAKILGIILIIGTIPVALFLDKKFNNSRLYKNILKSLHRNSKSITMRLKLSINT